MMEELNSRIGYNLYRTGMLFRREGLRFLKQYGITPEQWQVLMILSARGGQTQKQICECTLQDAPTLSRTISRMIRDGLVTASKSKKDRRAVEIKLAKKGLSLVKKSVKSSRVYEHTDKLLSGFDEEKKKKLIELLNELRACLEGSCGKKTGKDGGYHD